MKKGIESVEVLYKEQERNLRIWPDLTALVRCVFPVCEAVCLVITIQLSVVMITADLPPMFCALVLGIIGVSLLVSC